MSLVPKRAATEARGLLAPLARALLGMGVSANAVTVVGLLLTIVGAAFVALGQPVPALIALLIGSLADTLDGQIAKAAGGGTKLGAFLDSTFDRISDSALAGGVIVLAVFAPYSLLVWPGLLLLVSGSLVPYMRAKAESLGLAASVGIAPREARLVILVIGVALWAATADPRFLAAAVAVVALLSTVTAAQRFAHVARALRDT
jgi:CDP-diacylglycerol--glycerol-3-phosphate 3-phosphatidyltransferase